MPMPYLRTFEIVGYSYKSPVSIKNLNSKHSKCRHTYEKIDKVDH